jgi:hypothetical protein
MNKAKAILVYYSQILVPVVICTLLFCKAIQNFGWEVFALLFLAKAITTILAMYFNNVFRAKEVYFYYNMGIKKWLLQSVIFTGDVMLFLVILLLFFKPR